MRSLRCCTALLALLALAPPALARPEDGPRVTACAAADAPAGPRLHVTVTGARRVAGNVTITVYGPKPERFLASHAYLARQRVTLRTTSAEACFALAAPSMACPPGRQKAASPPTLPARPRICSAVFASLLSSLSRRKLSSLASRINARSPLLSVQTRHRPDRTWLEKEPFPLPLRPRHPVIPSSSP